VLYLLQVVLVVVLVLLLMILFSSYNVLIEVLDAINKYITIINIIIVINTIFNESWMQIILSSSSSL